MARPELRADVDRMVRLFTEDLGYRRVPGLDLDPTRGELLSALGRFARSHDRTPDDYVVVYLAAHGAVVDATGDHFLITADGEPDDLTGTALRTEELARVLWEGTGLHRVLLLIDSCHAEAGANDALMQALRSRRFGKPPAAATTGFGVIASAGRKEFGNPGRFSRSFERAVLHEATAGHAPHELSVESVLASMSTDPDFPPWQRPRWAFVDGTSSIPGFLPNPRYLPGAEGLHLDEIDRMVTLRSQERRHRQRELTSHFLPRARGTDIPTDEVWDFTGRRRVLQDVSGWLRSSDGESTVVVTGDPGSGKSSVLGMLTILADPERRGSVPTGTIASAAIPPEGCFAAAVHANHKTVRQVLDAVCVATNISAETVGGLIAGLQRRGGESLVVLIDAVDEALDPGLLVTELLQPLAELSATHSLRLLLGARRHIAERFTLQVRVLDLDSEEYTDPDAVLAYVKRLLTVPGSTLADEPPELVNAMGAAVAEAAGLSFLVARITARTLIRQAAPDPYDPVWRGQLPRLPGEAMERDLRQQLGNEMERARQLLVPLALTQGAGLPWAGLWPQLASVLAGASYTDEDIVWLRRVAGSYVVESVENSESVYRIYHQALVEYLRQGLDLGRAHGRVTRFLLDQVPAHLDHGGLPPYLRSFLGAHAAEAGLLDEVAADARYLVHAERDQLLAVLLRARHGEPRRAGRALADVHARLDDTADATPAEIGARLRLAALRQGNRALAASVDRHLSGQPWRARWTLWEPRMADQALRDGSILTGVVGAVQTGPGRAHVLTARDSSSAASWNLMTGAEEHRYAGPTMGDRVELWVTGGTRSIMITRRDVVRFIDHAEAPQVEAEQCFCEVDPDTGAIYRWLLPPWPRLYDRPAPGSRVVQAVAAEDASEPMIAVRFASGQAAVYLLSRPERGTYRDHQRARRAAAQPQTSPLELRTARLLEVLGANVTAIGRVLGGSGVVYENSEGRGTHWRPHRVGERYWHSDRRADSWWIDNTGAVALVALSDDGGNLTVVSSRRGGTLRIFRPADLELPENRPRVLDQAPVTVSALDAYQSGSRRLLVAVTTEGLLLRYDLGVLRPLGGPIVVGTRGPSLLRILELGERLCIALNGTGDALRVRDLFTGEHLIGAVRRTAITTLRFLDRDGSAGVAGNEAGGLRFWGPHGAPAEEVNGHRDRVLALDAVGDPAGDPLTPARLVSVGADDMVHCWEVGSPHPAWSHQLEREHAWSHPPTCAVVLPLPEGALAVTAHDGGSIRVHLATAHSLTETARFRLPDPSMVSALAADRSAGRVVLAVATFDGAVTLWDETGTPLPDSPPEDFPVASPSVISLARDVDGTLVVVCVDPDSGVHLWTADTRGTDSGPAVQRIGGEAALVLTGTGRMSVVVIRDGVGPERWIREGGVFQLDETFGVGDVPRPHHMGGPRTAGSVPQPDRAVHTDRVTAFAALNSDRRPLRLLAGQASGRIDNIDSHLGPHSTSLSHDVHAVTAVALTELQGGRQIVLSGTDDGRVMANALDTGQLVGNLTSRHAEPVATVRVIPYGDRVRIHAVHRDDFIQRWDFPSPDSSLGTHGLGGGHVLPVICDCPAFHRTTEITRLTDADVPWEGWTLEGSDRETVAGKDLVRPGGRMAYRIVHPEGFHCRGAWQVVAGHRTLVLAQDTEGALRVGLPDGDGWVQGVRLNIAEPLAVCTAPSGDQIAVLATDHERSRAVLRTYSLDALITPATTAGRRTRLRRRRPAPLIAERQRAVGSIAASGLLPLPAGAGSAVWALIDGPLIRLLNRDTDEVMFIDVGAHCLDLASGLDGALVVATRRGTVVIDLPSSL
ncbi:caspase family protein [Streptomyces parvus]|uniref:caspase family protein n=1 Tax=Streptomyces parvus TaxID=66428 RepID=UPI0033CAC32F